MMMGLYGRWYSTTIQALNIYIESKNTEFQLIQRAISPL